MELDYKYGFEVWNTDYTNIYLNQSSALQYTIAKWGTAPLGSINKSFSRFTNQNSLATASVKLDFQNDFKMNIPLRSTTIVGYDYRKREYTSHFTQSSNLAPYPPINLNSGLIKSNGDGLYAGDPLGNFTFATYGILVSQSFDWGNLAGISGGFRSDYSSEFGEATKPFTFPRGAVYFRPSELIKMTNLVDWKIRGAYGEAGIQPGYYARQVTLGTYPLGSGGLGLNLNSQVANPALRVQRSKELEVGTDISFKSNLQKNEELKSALLQETPWVLEAKNESQQKKNIALLFDMVKMSAEQAKAINKLKEMQSSNGGFVWFKGGADDRYITQYIITGVGHLKKLKALVNDDSREILLMVSKALPYLDKKIKDDYDWLIKNKVKLNQDNLNDIAIQYLYMRSFFSEYKVPAASQTAVAYYTAQAKKYWLQNSKYMQAMIALALYRGNDAVTPKAIIKSLKENAIVKEEMGMYWKEWATGGYYWHQAPVESQALMIEAFSDIDKTTATVDDLKTWLLKQKQTQNWKTTKATAEACYALLLNGSNWLVQEKEVTIQLGNSLLLTSSQGGGTDRNEEGTGYFKKTIEGKSVKPEMGNVSVSLKSSQVPPSGGGGGSSSWGSVYWQYFEDLDKITTAETPLKLKKQLFVERNTDKGPVLEALADGAELKVGDKVKVRIELKADRDMEYVHMKDMRAACMEPVNVLSEYKWQGGLGYYESTKDASTNFFFSWLSRGTYVFEYTLFVTHAGDFSNGITTIQCMYAPEFTAHSEGIRVSVE